MQKQKLQPIPAKEWAVLILEAILDTAHAERREIFTTVRRWTPKKELFYRSMQGKVADIVINEVKP